LPLGNVLAVTGGFKNSRIVNRAKNDCLIANISAQLIVLFGMRVPSLQQQFSTLPYVADTPSQIDLADTGCIWYIQN
jgi:hypothetical protein